MAVRQAEIASDRQRKREDLFQRNLAKANELERRQFETSAIQKDKLVSMDRTRIQIRKEKARQYGEMIARTIERSVKSSSGSTLLTDASSEEFTLSDVKKGMKKVRYLAMHPRPPCPGHMNPLLQCHNDRRHHPPKSSP